MKKALFLGISALLFSTVSLASQEMVDALKPLTTKKYNMSIDRTKVRGSTARQMLEDYAVRVKEFEEDYTVSTRLSSEDFPDVDEGNSVVGLTKIVDVVGLIADAYYQSDELSEAQMRSRKVEVRNLLFKVRDLGGRIGIESDSWSACGVSFPGVIILDTNEKEVISISPANTEC